MLINIATFSIGFQLVYFYSSEIASLWVWVQMTDHIFYYLIINCTICVIKAPKVQVQRKCKEKIK